MFVVTLHKVGRAIPEHGIKRTPGHFRIGKRFGHGWRVPINERRGEAFFKLGCLERFHYRCGFPRFILMMKQGAHGSGENSVENIPQSHGQAERGYGPIMVSLSNHRLTMIGHTPEPFVVSLSNHKPSANGAYCATPPKKPDTIPPATRQFFCLEVFCCANTTPTGTGLTM
ncbi:MAG: hypothetical protein Q8O25_12110 [Sulfurisoma sp.]|nr:hypothetical protein [Sulfurisoma sp.]